jgi:hypothetical protein
MIPKTPHYEMAAVGLSNIDKAFSFARRISLENRLSLGHHLMNFTSRRIQYWKKGRIGYRFQTSGPDTPKRAKGNHSMREH